MVIVEAHMHQPNPTPADLTPRAASTLVGIVVLTFGPRASTRGMVKALNKLAGQFGVKVVEVAAINRPGDTTGSTPRGRLIDAVSSLPPGPMLLVHDDVSIDALSLNRLIDAHVAGAVVAVPMSNDRNTDHFHGPLPAAGAARAQLRQIERSLPATVTPISAARASCLVANTTTIVELCQRRIHDPFTTLSGRGVGLFAVEGAIAAHDSMCGRQVRLAGRELDRPLLVASMIVKNEQDMLPGCLESLKPLVDRIEIVDTGSTDDTVAIATNYGANVSHIEWRDDFAWARNHAADQCRDAAFTLWIDADERISTADIDLARDVLGAYRTELDALDITILNRNNGIDAEPSSVFRARRIVRSDLLSFTGRIHEVPSRYNDPGRALEATTFDLLTIDHLGYADAIVAERGKAERNLQLARNQHGDERSIKASIDLARSLMLAGDSSEEAIALLRDAVTQAEGTRADWFAYLLGSLAGILMNAGELDEAAELARTAFETLPTDDLAAAVFAGSMVALDRPQELLDVVAQVSIEGVGPPVFRSAEHQRQFAQWTAVARARCGEPEAAWDSVIEWSTGTHEFAEADWASVAAIAAETHRGMGLIEALIPIIAQQGNATGLLPAMAKLAPPEVTALLAVGAAGIAGPTVDVVWPGIVAAMVSDQWPIFDELASMSHVLSAAMHDQLADRLRSKQQHQRADAIAPATAAASGLVASFGGSRG
jgi:tetratricopeptide (TPR) repeat protein